MIVIVAFILEFFLTNRTHIRLLKDDIDFRGLKWCFRHVKPVIYFIHTRFQGLKTDYYYHSCYLI